MQEMLKMEIMWKCENCELNMNFGKKRNAIYPKNVCKCLIICSTSII